MWISILVNTILVVSAATPWAAAATTFDDNSKVLDLEGESLKAGSLYYVVSVIRGGGGGGLSLRRRNHTCPLYVAQERSDLNRGLPVRLTPISGDDSEIRVGVDLKVESVAFTTWRWRLDVSSDPERTFVATGGTPSSFRIERVGGSYVLAFCPVLCDTCNPLCDKLGIYFDGSGNRWLASPGSTPALLTPFRVYFVKVKST